MGVGSDLVAWFVRSLMNAHDNSLPYMGALSYSMALFCVAMIWYGVYLRFEEGSTGGCDQYSDTDLADRMSYSGSIIQNST
jgi:hypothetical protein